MSRRSTAAPYRRQPKNIRSGRPTPLDLFDVHQNRLAGVERLGSSCLAGDRGRNDEKKAAREMQVFENFVKRSGLPIDRQSIRKCDPPEPDMLCKVSGEYVAFELAEVCSPEIPRAISHIPPTEGVSNFIRSGNPVSDIARKKIKKSKDYRTDYPIELLFYTDGRVVQPPDMSILSIQESFSSDAGRFRRVWFMGEPKETCECVVDET